MSCVNMYKDGRKCPAATYGKHSTAVRAGQEEEEELCCSTKDKQVFANVWSLRRKDNTDFLLSSRSVSHKFTMPTARSVVVSHKYTQPFGTHPFSFSFGWLPPVRLR